MSRSASGRRIYRALLYLHPAPFRERFAPEMLWIFDATALERGVVPLLADAVSSLVKQWTSTDTVPQPATSALHGTVFQGVQSARMSFAQLGPATVLASIALFGFFKLAQQPVPLPQSPKVFEVRRAPFNGCLEHVAPPSRVGRWRLPANRTAVAAKVRLRDPSAEAKRSHPVN